MVHKSCTVTVVAVLLIVVISGRPWTVPVESARILAVSTVASRSHWNFIGAVLGPLTDAGHHVTVFTQFPDGDRDNYTEVDTSGNFPILLEMDFVGFIEKIREPRNLLSAQTEGMREHCDIVHGDGRLGDIVKNGSKSNFDLIVVQPLVTDCVSYLAHSLDVPIIYLVPSPMITYVEQTYTGHMPNPACVSHIYSRQSVPKTFVQRFANTALLAYSVLVTRYHFWKMRFSDPQPYDASPTVHPSMVFLNTHYIIEAPRPTPQNVVEIGGIHLKPPKTIPKNILDFIEDAPHGVIFLTFGSVTKFSSLPDHIQDAFREALSQVPQKVLWKYEGEMKDKPINIMIQKWFPQREILLHPNVKLFISHGGISGVYETVDAGVPVLGFPLFLDQPRNIEHLVYNDMAISMELLTVTKDTLLNSISELINNEKYKNNAKIHSQRFKDRPMTPQQSVVYWTEYVVRHKGAPHLASYSLNLTWYQYFSLDVIVVVLICVSVVLFVVYTVFMFVCRYRWKNVKVKSQ